MFQFVCHQPSILFLDSFFLYRVFHRSSAFRFWNAYVSTCLQDYYFFSHSGTF